MALWISSRQDAGLPADQTVHKNGQGSSLWTSALSPAVSLRRLLGILSLHHAILIKNNQVTLAKILPHTR